MKYQNSLTRNCGQKLLLAAAGMLVVPGLPAVRPAVAQVNATPAFDAASLKDAAETGVRAHITREPNRTGGRFTWTAALAAMVSYAYRVAGRSISGTENERSFYTVTATMDASATDDQVRLILRALLVDRFRSCVTGRPKTSPALS